MRLGVHLPTYYSWTHMLQRCTNPAHEKYADYGGRRIDVASSWYSYQGFLADMGERNANQTLERINNNLGYNKNNCKWATRSEQQVNKRIETNLRPNNKTGIAGLYYNIKQNQWAVNFRNKHQGSFYDFFEAVCNRKSLEAKERS